jgi:hypothetical protein
MPDREDETTAFPQEATIPIPTRHGKPLDSHPKSKSKSK